MPVTAKFIADFSSFTAAVDKAEAQLVDFEHGANKVGTSLNRMVDQFSGRKLIQEATVMSQAIEKSGGVATLTGAQLQQVGAKAAEAAEKMKRLGIEVPPELQKVADAASALKKPLEDLGSSTAFDLKKAISDPAGAAKDHLSGLASLFGPTGTAMAAFAGVAAGLGAGLIKLGSDAEVIGAQIGRMGLQFNIPVGAVSDLRFAVKAAGGDFDGFGDSLFTFQKRLEENGDIVGKGLDKIGLSLRSVQALRPDEQFLAISDALRATGAETNKSAVAFELFGRQGKDILPLLLKPLSDLTAESEKLGATWTDVDVAAARAFRGEVTKMAAETEEAWTSLGRVVAPITNDIVLGWDRMKLAAANVAVTAVEVFPAIADALRHALGSTGDLELAEQTLAATQDTTNRLFKVAAAEGLKYGDQVQEVATKMLAMGFSQQIVVTQTGLAAAAVRLLAGDLKATAVAADAYADAWQRIADAFAKGAPSLAGVTASTKGLVADLRAVGATEADIVTATGLSVAQLGLLKKAQDEAGAAAKKTAAEHAAAQKQIEAAVLAVSLAYQGFGSVAATIDALTLARIRDEHEHGAALSDLAVKYQLSAGQAKALDEQLKFEGTVLAATTKMFRDLVAIVPTVTSQSDALRNVLAGLTEEGLLPASNTTDKFNKHLLELKDIGHAASGTIAAFNKETEKTARAAKNASDVIGEWANALGELAQFSGGAFGDTVNEIAHVVDAFGRATKAAEEYTAATNVAGKAMALVHGASAIAEATDTPNRTSAVIGGAAAGARVGMIAGPYGAAVGAVAGALVGYFRSAHAAERATNDLRDAFVAAHGDINQLNVAAQAAGLTLDRMLDAKSPAAFQAAMEELNTAIAHHADIVSGAGAFGLNTDELKAAADRAKEIYEYVRDSGKYAGSQIEAAFVAAEAAAAAAGDTAAQAWLDARTAATTGAAAVSAAIDELQKKRDGLSQSIATEAPEAVMGVTEAAIRAQIADVDRAIEAQRAAAAVDPIVVPVTIAMPLPGEIDQAPTITIGTAIDFADWDRQLSRASAAGVDEFMFAADEMTAALKTIDVPTIHVPIVFDYPTLERPEAVPMASGGMGRVTRPTLFLAGEAGAEDYAFSGGGSRFAASSSDRSSAAPAAALPDTHVHVHISDREIAHVVVDALAAGGTPFGKFSRMVTRVVKEQGP